MGHPHFPLVIFCTRNQPQPGSIQPYSLCDGEFEDYDNSIDDGKSDGHFDWRWS